MKRLLLAVSLALLALSPAMALAGQGNGKGHGKGHGPGHGHHDNGKHKGWKKGERIPAIYLERRYYVEDYRHHHLAPPPHGHRWVRTDDGKYILIAVATGIIADILLHH